MFQDDKMIPLLTAIVVMIALGAVVQRMDGISDYISEPAPAVRLVEDTVPVAAGKLRRIDVFANDLNITDEHRIALRVAKRPDCGQVFIQDDMIQYLAEDACAGRQTIIYTIAGIEPAVAGEVTAFVSSDNPRPQPAPPARTQPSQQPNAEELLALVEDAPTANQQPSRDRQDNRAPAGAEKAEAVSAEDNSPSFVEVLTNGAAETAEAAQPELITVEPQQPVQAGAIVTSDTQGGSDGLPDVIDMTNLPTQPTAEPARDVAEDQQTGSDGGAVIAMVQPAAPVEQPAAVEKPILQELPAEKEQELVLAPVKHFQPAAPGAKIYAPRIGRIERRSDQSPEIAPAPSISLPVTSAEATDFTVGVIPLSEPKTAAPAPLGVRTVIDRRAPSLRGPRRENTRQDLRLAALDPDQSAASEGVAPALSGDLVDKDQPPPKDVLPAELHPIPKVRDTAALQAAQQAEQNVGRADTSPEIKDQSDPTRLASLPTASAPCVTPPATTIDVGRAAQSTISIVAPCHANTIAELTYSGLRFAVPLNGEGGGQITALGFESNSAALLIFDNGEKIDFDLPFKGVKRVARVALVWDMPVNLELNAFEFGAKTGDDEHVWSGNPRSFRDIRKTGGGYLTAYRAYAGVGQNVQIYTHYSRNGTNSGIIKLMIDFASRNRDLLDGTCGNGQYAAPQFLVMRSENGRKDRPVLRKLAAMACSDVPAEKGDKRLISGAVNDLVISR